MDGWSAGKDPLTKGILQPRSAADRNKVAVKCCEHLKVTIPMVVDDMDDRVGHAYSAMPDRLYIVDRDGRVAYKAGRGPSGFKPSEMEQSLMMLLLEGQTARGGRSGKR